MSQVKHLIHIVGIGHYVINLYSVCALTIGVRHSCSLLLLRIFAITKIHYKPISIFHFRWPEGQTHYPQYVIFIQMYTHVCM